MRRDPRKNLDDIRHAGALIRKFIAGKARKDYVDDEMLRAAVERQFTIVGEALRRLEQHHPEIADRISSRKKIVGFRNALIHGYDEIVNDTVWNTAQRDLPVLLREVRALLKDLNAQSGS